MARHRTTKADRAYAEAERRVAAARETGVNILNLSIDGLTKIPPLAGFTTLHMLDFSATRVSNLAPLAGLTALLSLYLQHTQVSDLTPLSGLTALQYLNLDSTEVSDLAPLAGLTALQSLSLDGTHVSDLAPLVGLTALLDGAKREPSLMGLWFANCPLADKTILRFAKLGNPERTINTISYLREQRAFEKFEAGGDLIKSTTRGEEDTRLDLISAGLDWEELWGAARIRLQTELGPAVFDAWIRPLALTSVIDDDLEFSAPKPFIRNWVDGHYVNRIERALRAAGGDPNTISIVLDANFSKKAKSSPLTLPAQGPGPRFAVKADGVIRAAPVEALDSDGNDVSRLKRLHGPLQDASSEFLGAFNGSAINTYKQLFARASTYHALISQPLDKLDFTILYAAGLRLENARAAAERQITDGIVPPLEDHQFESLKSLSTLHGVFISATADGQALLTDAERIEMKREDVEATKRDIVEIVEPLVDEPDIIDPAEPQDIVDIVREDAPVNHPERRVGYSYAATSNLIIVLGSYAMLGFLPSGSELIHAAEILAGTGAHTALTKRGRDARQFAMLLATDAANAADKGLQAALRRGSEATKAYILRHEAPLRRLASRSARFKFINDILDWLKAQG
jgi:hypothetical protein